jgi:hypothetical protein
LSAPLLRTRLAVGHGVAPSREPACRSGSSLVIPWPHGGRHPLGRLGARPALGGRLHIGTVGLAGREIIPIILCILHLPSDHLPPYRIHCRQKAISRGRVKGKSFRRNASTEHTIENDNPKHSPAQNVMSSKSDLGDSKVLCARPDLMCSRTLKVLFVRKGYAWQQPGGGIRGKECRLLPHPKPTEMLEQNCVSDTAECGRRRRGLMNACAAVVVSAPYC